MSRAVEHAITAAVTALVSSLLIEFNLVEPLEASKAAQDQCCPIARECVEAILR